MPAAHPLDHLGPGLAAGDEVGLGQERAFGRGCREVAGEHVGGLEDGVDLAHRAALGDGDPVQEDVAADEAVDDGGGAHLRVERVLAGP